MSVEQELENSSSLYLSIKDTMEFPDSNTSKYCSRSKDVRHETISNLESNQLVAGEDIVDLTYEVFTSSFVDLPNKSVDLTSNSDSIVVIDEDPKCRSRHDPEQYVLSSGEEEEAVMVPDSPETTARSHSRTARSSETISCPICMDTHGEIVKGGRTLVSSQCGHLFCNICICESLAKSQTCPTCRKKLNYQQCHPIYI